MQCKCRKHERKQNSSAAVELKIEKRRWVAVELKENSEHVTANATLKDEGAYLRRASACSWWKAADSGRLGYSGNSQGSKGSGWSRGNLKAIFPGGSKWRGKGMFYRAARGSDVVG